MKKDIAEYMAKCLECQRVKALNITTQRDYCNHYKITKWKWEIISIDFIIGFPGTTKKHDVIMLVVDKLRKEAHLFPFKSTFKAIDVVDVFIK